MPDMCYLIKYQKLQLGANSCSGLYFHLFQEIPFPFYNGNGHNLIMCTFISSSCFIDLLIKQISSYLLDIGCNEANH